MAPLVSELLGSPVCHVPVSLPPRGSASPKSSPPSSLSGLSPGKLTHGSPGPLYTQCPLPVTLSTSIVQKHPSERPTDLNLFLMVVILLRGRWSKGAFPHLRASRHIRMSKDPGYCMKHGGPPWGTQAGLIGHTALI